MTVTIYRGETLPENLIAPVALLADKFSEEYKPRVVLRMNEMILRSTSFIAVSTDEENGIFDGYGTGHVYERLESGEIGTVYVLPYARRNGKGSEIFQALENALIQSQTVKEIKFFTRHPQGIEIAKKRNYALKEGYYTRRLPER